MDERIIAVAGPTASGKSRLALALCEIFGCELVSLDSMQIYRGLDIGTAKPSPEEQKKTSHHMIDICEPDENFSSADFAGAAHREISGIRARGNRALLCGGTGLYLDSVLGRIEFGDACADENYRRTLAALAERSGAGCLHDMLSEIDPEAAEAINANNVRRVIRALEIYKLTGMTKTEWDRKAASAVPYESTIIGLDFRNRTVLHDRINRRVDEMMAQGLESEVRYLLSRGFLGEDTTAGQAIGYKELRGYIEGTETLAAATERIKARTRQYAKRQLTWLRRNPKINWLYPDDYKNESELVAAAEKIISEN